MNILLTIKQEMGSFTTKELVLGNFILNHANTAIRQTIEEMAQESGVSNSTIVRFAKRFFPEGGFKEFKLALMLSLKDNDDNHLDLEMGEDLDDVVSQIHARMVNSFQRSDGLNSIESFKEAISHLESTDEVLTLGEDIDYSSAVNLSQKINAIGKSSSLFQNVDTIGQELLHRSYENLVIIIITHDLDDKQKKLLRYAKENSIPTIVICRNTIKVEYQPKLAVLKYASDPNECTFDYSITEIVSQNYIIELLYYGLLFQNIKKNKLVVTKLRHEEKLFWRD